METSVKRIVCPNCGHHMHVILDASNGDQDYYEDCTNCCHSIHLNLHINELHSKLELNVSTDNEQVY